jgi:drug/metabolite transporter (DMT)-like permease
MSLTTAFDRLPGVVRGGIWMMSAALCFTVMTALIRETAAQIHPVEIAFFRAATNLVLMLPFAFRMGRGLFRSANHRAYGFRGLVGFTFQMSYFPGAAMIAVAESQALIFTAPLWATMMAVTFLGERLYRHRAVALIVGFAGALIILRPGFETVSIGSLLVLIAALANATSHVIVTYTTRSDHPDQAVFYLALYSTPLAAIAAAFVWRTPNLEQLGLLVAIGALATLNQRFQSRAFASADATAVLPFDFVRLPFAGIIGIVALAELPDPWVWAGGVVIFAASVYLARCEARASRRPPP